MLLQTDGANPTPHTRPGKVEEVEGRWPEEGEDSMTGWVTVRGRRVCQEETKTEEMETPEAKRIADPIPNPPPRTSEVAEDLKGTKWWQVSFWWLNKKEREEVEKRSAAAMLRWRRAEREGRQQEKGGGDVRVAEQEGEEGGEEFYIRD